MPKLPTIAPKKIIKILESQGFVLDRIRGSHHIYYHPETKKRVIVPLLEILRQAGIGRDELRDLK
jgi:predicted RNA binding protein YcfA (HicA-like mRNA interferase family)